MHTRLPGRAGLFSRIPCLHTLLNVVEELERSLRLKSIPIIIAVLLQVTTGLAVAFSSPQHHWVNLRTDNEVDYIINALAYDNDTNYIIVVYQTPGDAASGDRFSVMEIFRDNGSVQNHYWDYPINISFSGIGKPTCAIYVHSDNRVYIGTDTGYIVGINPDDNIVESNIRITTTAEGSDAIAIRHLYYDSSTGRFIIGGDGPSTGYSYIITTDRLYGSSSNLDDTPTVLKATYISSSSTGFQTLWAGSSSGTEVAYLKDQNRHLLIAGYDTSNNQAVVYNLTKSYPASPGDYNPGLYLDQANGYVYTAAPLRDSNGYDDTVIAVFYLHGSVTHPLTPSSAWNVSAPGRSVDGVSILGGSGTYYLVGTTQIANVSMVNISMLQVRFDPSTGDPPEALNAWVLGGQYDEETQSNEWNTLSDYLYIGASTRSFSDYYNTTLNMPGQSILVVMASPSLANDTYTWQGTPPAVSHPSSGLVANSYESPPVSIDQFADYGLATGITVSSYPTSEVTIDNIEAVNHISSTGGPVTSHIGQTTDPAGPPTPVPEIGFQLALSVGIAAIIAYIIMRRGTWS